MKYIDAEKLKEIVDRVYKQYEYDYGISAAGSNMRWIYDAIDSLQQEHPEMDLEKEIDKIWNPRFNLGWDEKSLLSINHEGFTTIAKHFYELGLKTQKGE